ncbi:GNAT family N-acetyltransferase [Arthrobacter sp. BF1]|uniref:GNAT family N-acetyltransferase n=1 Tax=Arthrobacter sp. BF1 TaxID=2821145 RepID=UPI001C4FB4DD|nr:GNAT family N-acetyltransferase [Arthrobacter sp. BF1]
MHAVQVNRVNSDADRSEVEAFFASNINEFNRFSLMPRTIDPLKGLPSFILTVRDTSGLVAALHAGAAVEQMQAYVSHGLPISEMNEGIRDHAMIYSLAVRKDCRRKGIARALVDELLAQMSGFKRLYGVTGPESTSFYQACGFTLLPPGKAIELMIGRAQVNIPLLGRDAWFSIRF